MESITTDKVESIARGLSDLVYDIWFEYKQHCLDCIKNIEFHFNETTFVGGFIVLLFFQQALLKVIVCLVQQESLWIKS